MQFRVKDGRYLLNPRLVNMGLIKNYDYDMLLIGSSMVQVLDMNMIQEKTSSKPLKIASGDMNLKEIELMFSLSKKERVKTYIINLDYNKFFADEEPNRYEDYSYKDGPLNKIKYFVNYETNRFTPVDILLNEYISRQKDEISASLQYKTVIAKIGDFSPNLHLSDFFVKEDLCNRIIPDTTNIYNRMISRFDKFLTNINPSNYPDKEFIFFLPPYSAVYWHAVKEDGYYEKMIDFTKYILEKTKYLENVRIVCMHDADFIVEVRSYADMLHFSSQRNEAIITNLFGHSSDLTLGNYSERMKKFDNMINNFEKENHEWLQCDVN